MARATAVALALTLATGAARAQEEAAPQATEGAAATEKAPEPATLNPSDPMAVPNVPDEPLPEWKGPPPRSGALFLQVSPEVDHAQKIRQAGLWISSIGWVQLLAAGILYGWAVNLNEDVGHSHADGSGMINSSGEITQTHVFDPALEDERNRVQNASIGLISIGGTMAVGGFVIYTIGQAKITSWHKSHPRDPLPPLSGF